MYQPIRFQDLKFRIKKNLALRINLVLKSIIKRTICPKSKEKLLINLQQIRINKL